MKWIEAKVIFDHPDCNLAADLISDVFYDFGLQGVVVDDPDLEPEEGWPEDGVGRPGHHAVTGYVHRDSRTAKRCRILAEKLEGLKNKIGLSYRIQYKELDEQDWAHSWKAYFEPQKIGRKMVVKPTWRGYRPRSGEIVIELDPGMAFGTGTHPTTALCVSMIENYLKPGDSFLDVGTGSGILMIAAAKLAAGRICGVDSDKVAVNIAAENLMLNRVESERFHVICGHLVKGVQEKYDMVAANILTPVILDLLDDIRRVLKPGGVFICSGMIENNKNLVLASLRDNGFEILETATQEDWASIAGRLRHGAEGKG